jgi:hypothetical protein
MEMREVIYYPTFEVKKEDWLKFALLYLDKLDPIIPFTGDKHLSDRFWQLTNETDLIHVHRPEYSEGERATFDAIDHIEKILRNPERYEAIFHTSNVAEIWKNPKKQGATLFEDKYTENWENFCIANKLGRKTDEGLLLANELALVYMTLLAQTIGDARGISPITDYPSLDRFAVFTRRTNLGDAGAVATAQAVIQLHLPANFSKISLDSVIGHRNRPEFKKRQKAFHEELDKFIANAEKGSEPRGFSEALGTAWTDFRDDILRVGTGTIAFGLGVWILLESRGVELPRGLKEIASGLSLAVGSSITIRNTWRNTETKRSTRKYLADLKQLKPTSFKNV